MLVLWVVFNSFNVSILQHFPFAVNIIHLLSTYGDSKSKMNKILSK